MPSLLWWVTLKKSMGIGPPFYHDTNKYLPHTDHIVISVSKHLNNCEGTQQLHKFYHATFFSSAKTTFLEAIKKGYLWGCLGLTYQNAKQCITHNESATVKEHMNLQRQGTQSIKSTPKHMQPAHDYIYFATTNTTLTIHTNQTGKFPIQSSHGYKYVMICYAYSCNAILAHPIKNRSASEQLQACQHFTALVSCQACTNWTMKHKLILNNSLKIKMQLSSLSHLIITAQIQPNKPFKHGKITS